MVPALAAAALPVAAAPASLAGGGGGGMAPAVLASRHRLDSSFLEDAADGSQHPPLAVVVLNWDLPAITAKLWPRAALRVCADGGANRLHDELPALLPDQDAAQVRVRFKPDVIRGDLDSLRPDVLRFYERQLGVPVEDQSADQDSTDLQKCVEWVREAAGARGLDPGALTLVALGAVGGRLDHTLSNLSTLHKYRDMHVVLCGEGNLVRLVPAGRTVLAPARGAEGPTCGLVPLAGRAVASTWGLRWNLAGTPMEMGGLVSTSNLLAADEVVVESDADLVWTTELRA